MELTSPAFRDQARIPTKYTCDGAEVSPPLRIGGIPAGAASLVLIMDDPDAPVGTWDHWVLYDLPVVGEIAEGVTGLGTAGSSTGGTRGYESPCPPHGSHRYVFTVYALDTVLGLPEGASKQQVLAAVAGNVLGTASLLGRYSR